MVWEAAPELGWALEVAQEPAKAKAPGLGKDLD
jgi:hypothetical protein